jgi:hypothetical protein
MRNLFRIIGKLIAGILVLAFIVSAFASIFLFAFNSRLFDPNFYLNAFNEVNFFDQMPALAASQIKYTMGVNPCITDPSSCDGNGSGDQAGPPSYFQALSEKDWELLLEGLLPPEWFETQVLSITGGLFAGIEQGYGDIEVIISLKDLKEELSGEAGVEAIVQLLDNQPICSKDDLLEMTRVLQGKQQPGGDFLNCRPPDDFIENYTPQLEVLLRRSLRDVPDEVDLSSGLLSIAGSSKDPSIELFGTQIPILAFVKWIRWLITITPLACLFLLIIIALFGVYSYKGLSGWWGYPLAISGLMGLTVSLLVGPVVNFITNSFLRDRDFFGLSPALIESGSDLAVEVISSLFIQVRNFSLIVIGMGLTVIIMANVLGTSIKAKQDHDMDKEDIKEKDQIPDTDPPPEQAAPVDSDDEEKEQEPDQDESAEDEGHDEDLEED